MAGFHLAKVVRGAALVRGRYCLAPRLLPLLWIAHKFPLFPTEPAPPLPRAIGHFVNVQTDCLDPLS